jgi:glutathione synthase
VQHLFIADPLPNLHPDKDTTIAFMREATRRGHGVFALTPDRLRIDSGGRPAAPVVAVHVREDRDWYTVGEERFAFCDEFDVVWMRKDPPVDREFTRTVQLLTLVAPPALVVNDPRGLLQIDEKLFVMRFPALTAETFVSSRIDDLVCFLDRLGGEMVIKPIGGCGGEGVLHLRAGDSNLRSLLEMATQGQTRHQIAQRYIPAIREGDKRIILLEGEPIGAVLRVPQKDEVRANFHAGGRAQACEITDRERQICAALRPALREHGVLFAGIDVIGGWLTEVNVTSPTGIREIAALTGRALEPLVLDAVERRVKSAARPV